MRRETSAQHHKRFQKSNVCMKRVFNIYLTVLCVLCKRLKNSGSVRSFVFFPLQKERGVVEKGDVSSLTMNVRFCANGH